MTLHDQQLQTIESYDRTAKAFSSSIGRLSNYDHTYDAMADQLNEGDLLLDLACGPAQISGYIWDKKTIRVTGVDLSSEMLSIARDRIPDGEFFKASILDFRQGGPYDGILLGFGLPYLDEAQLSPCLTNAASLLKPGKAIYLSFMHGRGCRVETTSFGGDHEFLIHYHPKDHVRAVLKEQGLGVLKEFELDYEESDGSITKDVVLIARKKG